MVGNRCRRCCEFYKRGVLSTGDTRVAEGYSYSTTINISETGKGTFWLGSWGNDKPGHWPSGKYRIEVWYKGELVEESRFTIE